MALGDSVGVQAADEITRIAIPELAAALQALADRLDGATITLTVKLAPKATV